MASSQANDNTTTNKNLIHSILKNGFPESWKSIKEMSSNFDKQHVGWQIKISHKKSSIPEIDEMGVFAEENVKKGETLRIGKIGTNIFELTEENFKENIIKFWIDDDEKTGKKIVDPNKKFEFYYVVNYVFRNIYFPENRIYLWLPGSGINHGSKKSGKQTNIQYYFEEDHTIRHVATRDIKAGEEMLEDYSDFGEFPVWWNEFMAQFGVEEHLGKIQFEL